MRFRNDSPEESCNKPVVNNRQKYPCMRRKLHKGRCRSNTREAAEMDGVYECCRSPNTGNHREECYESAFRQQERGWSAPVSDAAETEEAIPVAVRLTSDLPSAEVADRVVVPPNVADRYFRYIGVNAGSNTEYVMVSTQPTYVTNDLIITEPIQEEEARWQRANVESEEPPF